MRFKTFYPQSDIIPAQREIMPLKLNKPLKTAKECAITTTP